MSKQIRISASRLKTLWECSLKFYYNEIVDLPETTHWKTHVGSIVHLLFECLMHPRRAALFERIIVSGQFVISDYPALVRFVWWQLRRVGIADKTNPIEIGELTAVAFVGIRRYFVTVDPDGTARYTPPPQFFSEKRFKITLASGAVISGFIDLLLVWPDRAVVIDLKSQASKFTKAELPSNVQAAMYQMACQREMGLIPAVEFIMLRHAPTERTPDKHIQRVEAPSAAVLAGLESYIDATYVRVNSFALEDAYSCACTDRSYCEFKCSFLRPFTYWVVCAEGDPKGLDPLSAHLSLDEAREACENEDKNTILERRHAGCALRWNPNQSTAS